MVILSWIFQKSIRTPPNLYFISLALADLLVGAFVFPLVVSNGFNSQWMHGLAVCQTHLIAYFSLCAITSFHLVAIAADRYRTITEGISYLQRRSLKSVFEVIVVIWIAGFWVSLPLILDWERMARDPTAERHCISKKLPFWVAFIAFTSLGLPSYLIIRIYAKVFLEIRRRLKARVNNSAPSATVSTNDNLSTDIDSENEKQSDNFESPSSTNPASKSKAEINLAKERRAAITLGIIIGSFLLCWLPWYTLTVYEMLVSQPYKPPTAFFVWLAILGLANSCINPIIYAARIPEFQNAVKKVLSVFTRLKKLLFTK